MKLPLDLGVKLFFRLLLPGFFLALGTSPLLGLLLSTLELNNYSEVAFGLSVVLMGWLIIIADLPIYMLYEGRRYWPKFLLKYFLGREDRRRQFLEATLVKYESDESQLGQARHLEAAYELREFPLNEEGGTCIVYPTRLGNLIEGFETYSDSRYGLDSVFFWPRIWLTLDKDVRDEVDSQQAVADSPIYVSAAFMLSALLWSVFSIASFIPGIPFYPLLDLSTELGKELPGAWGRLGLTAILFGGSFVMYRVSLYTHMQFGHIFKAAIDRTVSKFDEMVPTSLILERLPKELMPSSANGVEFPKDKFEIIRRYLQYRRVKCERCGESLLITTSITHACEETSG